MVTRLIAAAAVDGDDGGREGGSNEGPPGSEEEEAPFEYSAAANEWTVLLLSPPLPFCAEKESLVKCRILCKLDRPQSMF